MYSWSIHIIILKVIALSIVPCSVHWHISTSLPQGRCSCLLHAFAANKNQITNFSSRQINSCRRRKHLNSICLETYITAQTHDIWWCIYQTSVYKIKPLLLGETGLCNNEQHYKYLSYITSQIFFVISDGITLKCGVWLLLCAHSFFTLMKSPGGSHWSRMCSSSALSSGIFSEQRPSCSRTILCLHHCLNSMCKW